MELKSFLKKNRDLIIILTLYSFLAIFSLKYYQGIGGDEISYVNIAHAYAIGAWGDAINGYWSPLYSWLMTPFFLFGFTPIYGAVVSRILSLIVGFLTLISLKMLLSTFRMSKTVERAALLSFIPVILYFALMYPTPDLLVVGILVMYFSIIFSPNYSNSSINGILCGFIGAIAYLSKSYAFTFFIAHFLIFNMIYYFKGLDTEKKNNVLKNMILGISIFFVISGLWACTISEKYEKITISTAGEVNHNLVGPEYTLDPTRYINHPVYTDGLFKPPNNLATSIWDDTSYIKMKEWNPFDSQASFNHQITILWLNILYTIHLIESFFLIAGLLVIAILFFIWRSKSQKIVKERLIYLLITIFVYAIGYCLIVVEWRYLWTVFALMMIASFYLVDSLYRCKMININMRNVLLIILVISFIMAPINEGIMFSGSENYYYNLSNTLKDNYGINGNIASDPWGDTLTIAYYLQIKYYGQPKNTTDSTNLQKELEDNNIDYYFVWSNRTVPLLSNYKEITNGKINGLKIYARIKK